MLAGQVTHKLAGTGDILIIEDEADIRELIQFNLEKDGYKTRVARNGDEGLKQALDATPGMILMDIMMPVCDGLTALRKMRESASPLKKVPVIMLTAKGEESDIVVGLELGADDYVAKPFSPKELIARIRAVARRSFEEARPGASVSAESNTEAGKDHLKVGPIEMDLERHEAWSDGKPLVLTLAEFNLLKTLISKPGRVFTRDQILEQIAGTDTFVIDRNVDVHVRAVRKKLDHQADFIQTVRGVGYKCRD
jgi:two-component system alkaline phosphatase synthesis response regulator PhoP